MLSSTAVTKTNHQELSILLKRFAEDPDVANLDIAAYWKRPGNVLKEYFKSVEDSVECLRRAKLGCDASQVRMAMALASIADVPGLDLSSRHHYMREDYVLGERLNEPLSQKFMTQAATRGNPDALNFEEGFELGNRNTYATLPHYIRDPFMLLDQMQVPIFRDEGYPVYSEHCFHMCSAFYKEGILPVTMRQQVVGFPPEFDQSNNPRWASQEQLALLDQCARAGDPLASTFLAVLHRSPERLWSFVESPSSAEEILLGFCGRPMIDHVRRPETDSRLRYLRLDIVRLPNPHFSEERASYWRSVRAWNSKGTPEIPVARSLEDLVPTHLEESERLYNLGWAYIYSSHRNVPHAVDLLKHAAKLENRNASWQLGRIFEIENQPDTACAWYREAAELGHLNARSRLEFLQSVQPSIAGIRLPTIPETTPRPEYVDLVPDSIRGVVIDPINLEFLNTELNVPLRERMKRAIGLVEKQVESTTKALTVLQRNIDDCKRRAGAAVAKIDRADTQWQEGVATNEDIVDSIHSVHKQQARIFRKNTFEALTYITAALTTGGILSSSPGLSAAAGGAPVQSVGRMKWIVGMAMRPQTMAILARNTATAALDIEQLGEQITTLLGKWVDLDMPAAEKNELLASVERLRKSDLLKSLEKDELSKKRLLDGYCKLFLLYHGHEHIEIIGPILERHRVGSIETFIKSFSPEVNSALERFFIGVGGSADLALIYAEAGKDTAPSTAAHRALREFGDRSLWENRASYFRHASGVDLLGRLGLTHFGQDTQWSDKVSPIEKQAFMILFANAYGGNLGTGLEQTSLFAFGPDRHGRLQFFDDLIRENGSIARARRPREVEVLGEKELAIYREEIVRAYSVADHRAPIRDEKLFLRICGYEYCYPQAISQEIPRSVFASNPTGPAAVILADKTVREFVRRLGFENSESMNNALGPSLRGAVASAFVNFFSELGERDCMPFEAARLAVDRSFKHGSYPERFGEYVNLVTQSASNQFECFIGALRQLLRVECLTSSPTEVATLKAEIQNAPELFRQLLGLLDDHGSQPWDRIAIAHEIGTYSLLAPGNPLRVFLAEAKR